MNKHSISHGIALWSRGDRPLADSQAVLGNCGRAEGQPVDENMDITWRSMWAIGDDKIWQEVEDCPKAAW